MAISAWNVEVLFAKLAKYLLVTEIKKYNFCLPKLTLH
jgi:hypothetical protein